MHMRGSALLIAGLLLVSFGFAKDKTKGTLPSYVLQARTVAVVIDPEAGVSMDNPRANEVAQEDVKTALLNWGRFDPILSTRDADLIIAVRKGSGRLMNETVHDPRQNNRPGEINPTENGVGVGAQRGPQPGLSDDPSFGSDAPRPQTEMGGTDDSFMVFEGHVESPLDGSPAWRYVGKDGLRPHSVPAVAAFKKALEDAEKAAAKKP